MSHTPFIVASYAIAAALLTWCALAPMLQARKLKRDISRRIKQTENSDAPNT